MYRLLIVDDERNIIDGIRRIINWEKYYITEIETATSFQEAIRKLIEFQPHVSLIDVRLGANWGYDLLRQAQDMAIESQFIMISGYDDFEYVRHSLLYGAKDYLLKPIDRAKLELVIRRIMTENFHLPIAPDPLSDGTLDPILEVPYSTLSRLTNRIILIVQGEYSKNITLKYIADIFKMNSTYIGQIFLKETHMKFSEYLLAYRMYKARDMIENTNEKIGYIAHSVGYSHLNYFYTQFKCYYNFSPNDLRGKEEEEEEEIDE